MNDNSYTCNGCRRVLSYSDYPPVVGTEGHTCPDCSKGAKEIAAEVDWRLKQCGIDGEITLDYHTNKLPLIQLCEKYDYSESEILHRVELCVSYIEGEKRKDIPYAEWTKR